MAINVDSISYKYQDDAPYAIENVSATFSEGEFVALIGRTGSGKTTFMQHLNALLLPNEGSVVVDGIDTKSQNKREIHRNVGLLFQYAEHQLFAETCYDDIAFGLRNSGCSESEIKEKIQETIDMLSIDSKIMHLSPYELSGGQMKKIALAGVIAMKPKYLVLDEPTAGLDNNTKMELFDVLKHLNAEGMTVVFASHSIEDVAKIADRVLVFNEGHLVADGDKGEIFSDAEMIEKAGISLPQITEFYNCLAESMPALKKTLFTKEDVLTEIEKFMEK